VLFFDKTLLIEGGAELVQAFKAKGRHSVLPRGAKTGSSHPSS